MGDINLRSLFFRMCVCARREGCVIPRIWQKNARRSSCCCNGYHCKLDLEVGGQTHKGQTQRRTCESGRALISSARKRISSVRQSWRTKRSQLRDEMILLVSTEMEENKIKNTKKKKKKKNGCCCCCCCSPHKD
jgi:hypothetical protein